MSTRDLGNLGEELAIELLKKNGYKILQRNFQCKLGEIDIIALDKNTLVFVEVKTRWSKEFGLPEESITPWKIRKISQVSQYYKLLHPDLPDLLRIDAVCIDISDQENKKMKIIRNLTG